MKKMAKWVFTVPVTVVIDPERTEEEARAAMARQLARTPNDFSQQAWLRETTEIEVEA